jgi:hypothetical protein
MTQRKRRPKSTPAYHRPLAVTATEGEEATGYSLRTPTIDDSTTWQDEELTAPVVLPSRREMTVQLAPVNLIERFDEYKADENIAWTVIGLLVGAILGVIGNWATTEPPHISRLSVGLIIVLLIMIVPAKVWLVRLRQRADTVKRRLLAL